MRKVLVMVMAAVVVAAGTAGSVLAQEKASVLHRKAAEDFLVAMQTPEQLQEGITSMVDLMLQAQPMMGPYRQTIKDFYMKYLSWPALKDDYIDITADLLSEAELNEITAFFETPVGKTFIEKQPEMFQRTSELGFEMMQEHQQELMDILEEEAAKYAAGEDSVEAAVPGAMKEKAGAGEEK